MKAIEDFRSSTDFLAKKATIASKAMEDFCSSIKFAAKKATTTARAMEDFWASMEFQDEKADFVIIVYEVVKDAQAKVTTKCPGLDLDFLDELLALEEGEDAINASKDVLAIIAINACEDASAFAP